MEHPSRKDIRDALAALDEALGEYEQTTHASLSGRGIEDVAEALVRAYRGPSSYNVSELSQRIVAFIEQETKQNTED